METLQKSAKFVFFFKLCKILNKNIFILSIAVTVFKKKIIPSTFLGIYLIVLMDLLTERLCATASKDIL